MKKGGILKLFFAVLFLGIAIIAIRSMTVKRTSQEASPFARPASESEIPKAFSPYVAAGKIDEVLIRTLLDRGSVEVFILVDEAEIQTQINKLKENLGATNDTSEISEKRRQLLAAKKKRVLSGLAPDTYEIIENYQDSGITFIRLYEASAVLKLLSDSSVLRLNQNYRLKLTE